MTQEPPGIEERIQAAEKMVASWRDQCIQWRSHMECAETRVVAAEARAATASANCTAAQDRSTVAETTLKNLQAKMMQMEKEAQSAHSKALEATKRALTSEDDAKVAKTCAESSHNHFESVSRGVQLAQSQAAECIRTAQRLTESEAKKCAERVGDAEQLAVKNAMTASMAIAELRRKTGGLPGVTTMPVYAMGRLDWSNAGSGTTASTTGPTDQECGSVCISTPTRTPRCSIMSNVSNSSQSPMRRKSLGGPGASPLRPGLKAVPVLSPTSARTSPRYGSGFSTVGSTRGSPFCTPTTVSFGMDSETLETLSDVRSMLKEQLQNLPIR